MHDTDAVIEQLCLRLYEIGALKFGDFKMKVGLNSPVYFDLRVIVSYPKVMDHIADIVASRRRKLDIKSTVICGVPYTALPLATLVAVKENIPMLIRRKEPKGYGTMKLIEGKFQPGEDCLIIEDVVTSGGSILETAADLEKDGLQCKHAIIIVDREQGALINLTNKGIKALSILLKHEKLDQATVDKVKNYIKDNQIFPNGLQMNANGDDRLLMTFKERAKLSSCLAAKTLFELMECKKTTLCASLDVSSSAELLKLAQDVGPFVCLIKTHSDAVLDWTIETEKKLKELALKYNFILLEDRKLADIGNTVKAQCEKLFSWANLTTMHSISGSSGLDGVIEIARPDNGVFLVAELSSKNNLITPNYTKSTAELATKYGTVVAGFVCQNPTVFKDPGFIQLTPGVSLNLSIDNLGQQYVTPEEAVLVKGGDVIVVGRAITQSSDPKSSAKDLRDILWEAYNNRISRV